MRKSIGFKISLSFLIMALLPFLGILIFTTYYTRKNLNEIITTNLSHFERRINLTIREAYVNLISLANYSVMKDPSSPINKKLQEIKRFEYYHKIFEDITLLNLNGVVLASTSYEYRGEWANKRWFEQARDGIPFISPVHAILYPFRLVLIITIPIKDKRGSVHTVLTGQINMENIWEITDRIGIGKTGFVFIIDAYGNVLAHRDKEKLLYKIFPHDLRQTLIRGDVEFTEFVSDEEAKKICYFRSFSDTGLVKDLGWGIGIVQDKKEAYAIVSRIRKEVLFFEILGLLLILFLSLFLARRITKPIKALKQAADKIARGDLHTHLNPKTEDEIGELMRDFNRMTDELQKTIVSRDYINNIIRSMSDSLIVADAQGKIITVNNAACSLIEYNEDILIGKRIETIFASDIVPFKKIEKDRLIGGKEIKNYETYIESRTGKRIPIIFSSSVIEDEHGSAICTVCTATDITERKEVEKLKDEFVSTVSHELRTPLAIIKEVISVTLEGILGKTTEKQRDYLSSSLEAINRLSRLIGDLLNISRIEMGKLSLKKELVDIGDLVRKIVDPFHNTILKKGLDLNIKISQKPIIISIDKDRITEVFINLLSNAIKFTEQGSIEISIKEKDSTIECSVSDTGIGIDEKYLAHVFEKFQQFGRTVGPGYNGTGLGLSICKGIIMLHGGKISITSKLKVGTKIIFTLPRTHTVNE